MPATPKFYWRQPVTVPAGEDVGSDKWKGFAAARVKPTVQPINQLPPGYEPMIKNEFGKGLSDGRVTAEDLDKGYCEYDKPTYGDRSYGDTE